MRHSVELASNLLISHARPVKFATLKATAIVIILLCIMTFVVLPAFFSCIWGIQHWRYTRFCWRSQAYYSQVANACERLIAQVEPMPRKMRGDTLRSLPTVLRELEPDYVLVDTNLVLLAVGSGVQSRQIIWAPASSGPSWNLSTGSGESQTSRILFSSSSIIGGAPLSR